MTRFSVNDFEKIVMGVIGFKGNMTKKRMNLALNINRNYVK